MKMSTNPPNGQNGKLVKPKAASTPLKDKTNQISNGRPVGSPPNRSNQLAQSITFLANYSDEDPEENSNNSDKMKTKLKSMWNNVKYGWTIKVKPTFNLNNRPIWLLGVCYLRADKKQLYLSRQVVLNEKTKQNLEVISLTDSKSANLVSENRSSSSSSAHSGSPNSSELDLPHSNDLNVVSSPTSAEVLENFNDDFQSRIWFTYRRGFKKIPGSNFTTDCGWSCMLRSGQSLLAQAFLNHYLHRNWRFTGAKSDKEDMIHRMLIKWFADDNNPVQSPFSIHQLVHQSKFLGKQPGDWYGPSSVAYILKNALEAATNESNFVLDSVCIYVAQDCTIYLKDLIKLCTRRNQPSKYKSLSALKKDKTNYNSSHYTTVNSGMLLSGHSYLKSRKRLRSSLKSLGSSVDLAAEQFAATVGSTPKPKETVSEKGSASSAESNITSRNNSANQSIDDVFTNSTAVASSIIEGKSSSSFNLGDAIHLNSSHLKEKNLSTNSSTSSSSSTSSRSSKSTSSAKRHSTGSALLNELKKSNKKSKWKSVILLIPLRLGGEKFNPIYTNCIKKLFKSPHCIGIIGGKPKHSLYFVGVHDDKLIYLDPHYCQETIDTSTSSFPLNSWHCSTARKLPINRIDPSCTIGFYCKTEDDLNSLIEFTRKEMLPSNQKLNGQQYPIFLFDEVNSNSAYLETLNNNTLNSSNLNHNGSLDKNGQVMPKDRLVKVKHQYLHENGMKEIDSEDFVLL